MESFFSRYRNALVLIAVLLAQVVGLAVQVRRPDANSPDKGGVRLIRSWVVNVVTPPEMLFHGIGKGIRGTWSNYVDLIHVRKQNKDLKAELDRLRLEEDSLAEDARQGQRLQTLLGFKEKYIYKTVAAQVIGTSGTEQSHVLLIDKGSQDGLKPDMPVITPDGIVGKTPRRLSPHQPGSGDFRRHQRRGRDPPDDADPRRAPRRQLGPAGDRQCLARRTHSKG